MDNKLPVLSLPHGGGPWPFMKEAFGADSGLDRLEGWLRGIGPAYRGRAKALLVVSAHWEEDRPTVHFGAQPGMLYDYGGFPDFAYRLRWPAPGAPDLALRVEEALRRAGFDSGREEKRGYDHGTFIPLMLAYPEAELPVAQLSLVRSLDPDTHFRLGQALEGLRSEGVLIVASGMSYHNMRGFMSGDPRVAATARAFDEWLNAAVAEPDPAERRRRLVGWRSGPGALDCHPRSEHLVPLFVAAGAAGADPGRVAFSDTVMGVSLSGHAFGA